MESFRKEASEAFQMDISDCIFFVFSMGVTIVQYLFFTFMPGILGEKTGRNRIYVATGADEDCRSGIYMELIGV